MACRGPVPRPGRQDRCRSRPDRRRRTYGGGATGRRDTRNRAASGADGRLGGRRLGRPRLRRESLAGRPWNGPDLAHRVKFGLMSSTRRRWIAAAATAVVLVGVQPQAAVALADPAPEPAPSAQDDAAPPPEAQ